MTAPVYVLWQVLKTCRENRGLSQRAAAELQGVSQPTISAAESEDTAVQESTLVQAAASYGITVRDLLLEGLDAKGPRRRAPVQPEPAPKKPRTRRAG